MLSHQTDSLHYYTFTIYQEFPQLFHAVLTRHGGFSNKPWHSLNLGGSVGDDPACVKKNKQHAFVTLGRGSESAVDAWQVHGTDVLFAMGPRQESSRQDKADIILTDRKYLTLMMRFADCVPILLFDPEKQVVGLVHAGWQGTVKKAAQFGIDAMRIRYGSAPHRIVAGIGPSIGPDHYQIGADVIQQVRESFIDAADELLVPTNGSVHFDLWKANELLLRQSGVERIEVANLCTACNTSDFFSHRAEAGRTGRFGVMIGLAE